MGARQDAHCFLVGTLHPREENELHLIEFDEDENEIKCLHAYRIKVGKYM